MKKFKNTIDGVCDSVEKYVNCLEKQVKSAKEHQKNTTPLECLIENLTIKKLKFKSSSNDVWNERFLNLKNILTENDFFVPTELLNFLKKSNSRQSFSNTSNTLFQEVFHIIFLTVIFHFKLPSQGPYEAFTSSGKSQTPNVTKHQSS